MNRQYEDRMDRLEARCLRLERANRIMISGVFALVGIMAMGVFWGFRALEKPEHLKVASMTVCDDEGSTLAWVGMEEGDGRILLYNQHGEVFWSTPEFREARDRIKIPQDIRGKIGKMNLQEAQAAIAKVAVARKNGSMDAETNKRLKEEFRMLMFRIRELKREK